jgi:glycosyltransferase involved in cell wall biosynthesis
MSSNIHSKLWISEVYLNNMAPLISIITATFNSERYLENTILSVISQSYPGVEYIIVDGGSTDHTLDIVAKYRHQISKIISEPDDGIYDAFNKGIQVASGDVIYFLNSDDYLYDNDVIAEIANIFIENPGLQFVYGNVLARDEKVNYQYIRGKHFTCEDLKNGDMPPHPGFFVRRELVEKIGVFSTQYQVFEDFDFVIRCFLAAADQSYYFNRIIAVFRETGGCTDPEQLHKMNLIQKETVKKYFGEDNTPHLQLGEVNGLYKVWLESLLINEEGISHCLHKRGIKRVGIFGAMKTALYIYQDLKKEAFEVVCFLDNNPNMQQQTLKGLPIYPEEWLESNYKQLDAVILSIEGQHDAAIKARLEKMIDNHDVLILSWKDLARMGRSR